MTGRINFGAHPVCYVCFSIYCLDFSFQPIGGAQWEKDT